MYLAIKKKTLLYIFTFSLLLSIIIFPSLVLAVKRQEYLQNFIMQNYNEISGGFYEYKQPSSTSEDTSIIATRCSISVLSRLNILNSEILDDESKSLRTRNFFKDELTPSISENNTIKLAYALEGLDIMDKTSEIDSSVKNDIYTYLSNSKRIYGSYTGYALFPDENLSASIIGTYFAIKIYYHLNDLSIVDKTGVVNYIKSCLKDATVGKGFQSNVSSGEISLENTFAAVETLKYLDSISQLSTNEKDQIVQYIDSFYNNDPNNEMNYGGYSFYIEDELPMSTFLATYYATSVRFNLYSAYAPSDETIDWVLEHQNPNDGGFMDNIMPGLEQHSSTIISYYAVEILYMKDPTLSYLQESVWSIDINWWLVGGITALIVAIVVAIILGIKRRNRI
ncbi:MAG: prenyltransferase/squalene oxidase repeat-containing protein [Promethearchaeota archaeon]